jgi:1-pyrroline-4-hydroxy-2-carboxylate deaminase
MSRNLPSRTRLYPPPYCGSRYYTEPAHAFPRESVELFELAKSGRPNEALELYRWFLPLLRMDTVPKFVQLINLVQEQVGVGSARVRPPRLELTGSELDGARTIIAHALSAHPPGIISTAFDHAHEAAAVR